jgi:hypothetical protein
VADLDVAYQPVENDQVAGGFVAVMLTVEEFVGAVGFAARGEGVGLLVQVAIPVTKRFANR